MTTRTLITAAAALFAASLFGPRAEAQNIIFLSGSSSSASASSASNSCPPGDAPTLPTASAYQPSFRGPDHYPTPGENIEMTMVVGDGEIGIIRHGEPQVKVVSAKLHRAFAKAPAGRKRYGIIRYDESGVREGQRLYPHGHIVGTGNLSNALYNCYLNFRP